MKTFSCLVLFIFLKLTANSQNCQWAFQTNGLNDDMRDVTTDLNGNVYYVGTFTGDSLVFGNVVLPSTWSSINNIFLIKSTPSGNISWIKTALGQDADFAFSVKTDHIGNVYISGITMSSTLAFDNIVLNHIGSGTFDAFVAKYDSNGNNIWAKMIQGSENDYCVDLDVDQDGNIYVTGDSKSTSVNFGNNTITKTGTRSATFIAKYDSSGTDLWAKFSTANSDDYGAGITSDNFGNFYLTGGFSSSLISFGTSSFPGNNIESMYLIKFDSNGDVLWGLSKENALGQKMHVDSQNNLFLTGRYTSSITFGTNTHVTNGGYDPFLVKFDSSGQVQWSTSFGGNDDDSFSGIDINENHDIYLSGSFKSNVLSLTTNTLINNGLGDAFLLKLDSNGDEIWSKSYGGSSHDFATSIACDQNNSVYFTGDFMSPSILFDTISFNSNGNYEGFLAKVNGGISSVENNYEKLETCAYPNPSSGRFKISTTLNEVFFLQIFNTLGDIVYSSHFSNKVIELDFSNKASAIYFYKITYNNGLHLIGRLILEK